MDYLSLTLHTCQVTRQRSVARFLIFSHAQRQIRAGWRGAAAIFTLTWLTFSIGVRHARTHPHVHTHTPTPTHLHHERVRTRKREHIHMHMFESTMSVSALPTSGDTRTSTSGSLTTLIGTSQQLNNTNG